MDFFVIWLDSVSIYRSVNYLRMVVFGIFFCKSVEGIIFLEMVYVFIGVINRDCMVFGIEYWFFLILCR